MTKKLLTILFMFIVVCPLLIFTGCDNNDNPPGHICTYNQKVIDSKYKASDALCESKAKYFYSCACGEKGNTTFENGNILGHSYTNYIYDNNATCTTNGTETAICDRCSDQDVREKLNTKIEHVYNTTFSKNENNHWRECFCGDMIDLVNHEYDDTWFINGSSHWHECICGNMINLGEHSFDDDYNCVTCEGSITNLAIAQFDISKDSDDNVIEYVVQRLDSYYNVFIIGSGEIGDKTNSTSPLYKNNYANKVKNIIIGNNIKSIGNFAFYGCSNLQSIIIPEDIVEIGENAFKNCSALTSIIIPNNVTRIGFSAFSGCYSLNAITLPFVGGSAFANDDNDSTVLGYIFGKEEYWDSTRQHIDSDTQYYLPLNLKNINITGGRVGALAFVNCLATSITLSNDVTYIGNSAFLYCTSLQNFVIPQGITTIEYSTFEGCQKLKNITIPDSVESIGNYAFSGCVKITNLVLPDNLKTIGRYAFRFCNSLENVELSNLSGWKISGGSSIDEDMLSTPYKVAECLVLDFVTYEWIREV